MCDSWQTHAKNLILWLKHVCCSKAQTDFSLRITNECTSSPLMCTLPVPFLHSASFLWTSAGTLGHNAFTMFPCCSTAYLKDGSTFSFRKWRELLWMFGPRKVCNHCKFDVKNDRTGIDRNVRVLALHAARPADIMPIQTQPLLLEKT